MREDQMGIDDYIRSQIEDAASQRRAVSAAARQRTQQQGERNVRIPRDPEIAALVAKFLIWTRRSRVEPMPYEWRTETKSRRRTRMVPTKFGWQLNSLSANHNCDSGFCGHSTVTYLIISTTGEIGWTRASEVVGFAFTPAQLADWIAKFIIEKSPSTPWPY